MKPLLVLAKHPKQGWLLIHRSLNQIANLSDEEAKEINSKDAIIRSISTGFVAISYEITELCNVECIHCYLNGSRTKSTLNLQQQLKIIDQMESTGAIWLQISGGEPLTAPHFAEVYSYAWDKGFLITVLTNGTLLHKTKFVNLFKKRPPFRISVSVYGASEHTYEKVTQRAGSWQAFQKGIRVAQDNDLHLRMKVIELTENTHELKEMLELAQQGEECDHVRNIIPTLTGNQKPSSYQVDGYTETKCWTGCDAGTESFHVTADGNACLCKITREPSVPLEKVSDLSHLASSVLQQPSECQLCERRSRCHVCPSLHRLLTIEGSQPCARSDHA